MSILCQSNNHITHLVNPIYKHVHLSINLRVRLLNTLEINENICPFPTSLLSLILHCLSHVIQMSHSLSQIPNELINLFLDQDCEVILVLVQLIINLIIDQLLISFKVLHPDQIELTF